jgi:hypothetical protein
MHSLRSAPPPGSELAQTKQALCIVKDYLLIDVGTNGYPLHDVTALIPREKGKKNDRRAN